MMEKHKREIKKIADFQMRKSTHIRFLENCVAESVVPKGLRLNLQIQVGENSRLQEAVDRMLKKTSLQICYMIKEEHTTQLHESRGTMAELENKLKSDLSDKGKFNDIAADIFKSTEEKKNKIIDRQEKKLKSLLNERDGDVIFISEDLPKNKTQQAQRRNSTQKFGKTNIKPLQNTKQHQNKEQPKHQVTSTQKIGRNTTRPKPAQNKTQHDQKCQSTTKNVPNNVNEKEASPQNSKNFKTLGTNKVNKTYKEALTQGINKQELQKSISTLISCLQDLQKTEGLFVSRTDTSGESKNNFNKKSNVGKRRW